MALRKFFVVVRGEVTVEEPVDLAVTTTSLPNGQVGVAYDAPLAASGGTSPYTWQVIQALPDGLSLNETDPSDVRVQGTPTTEGDFIARVRVTDADSTAADSGAFPITILPALTALRITTSSLPNGQVGVPYAAVLQSVGGTPPYTYSIESGALPHGVALTPSTGQIVGVPTMEETVAPTFLVTDAVSDVDDAGAFSIQIADVADVKIAATSPLPDGEVGEPYSRTIVVTGGDGNYTLTLANGTLASGLAINGLVISGTPTTEQTATFTLHVVDGAGDFDERDFEHEIQAAGTIEGPHDHFESFTSPPHATLIDSWGLRDQAEINSLRAETNNNSFRYIWPNDPYTEPHDAAQLYIAPQGEPTRNVGDISGGDQLRFPIPNQGDGDYLLVRDFWFGPEWLTNHIGPQADGSPGALNDLKAFRLMIAGGHRLTTSLVGIDEAFTYQGADPAALGLSWDAWFGGDTTGELPPPMTRREPLWWTGTPYTQQKNKGLGYHYRWGIWNRWWVLWRQNVPHTDFTYWNSYFGVTVHPNPNSPDGRWNMVHVWHADETRGPTRIIYGMPMSWKPEWTNQLARFDFEIDSSDKGFTGPFYGYARNVMMFFNYPLPATPEDDTAMFKRPKR